MWQLLTTVLLTVGGALTIDNTNITSNATATLSDCQSPPASANPWYLALLALLSLLGIPVYLKRRRSISRRQCELPTLSLPPSKYTSGLVKTSY